jgi:hypothetical protein
MSVSLHVEGIGLCGPGLNGWPESRPLLSGRGSYTPTPAIVPASPLLPGNERRRAVKTVRLALVVGAEALGHAQRDPSACATVFASSGGDGETINEILKELASDRRDVSPTRFHNSVHNAPAGYWSIAVGSREPTSSLCCHDASFAAGLVESAAQATVDRRAVALIAYDVPYPEPLSGVRTIGDVFGVSLVFVPEPTASSFARIDLELVPASCAASRMADGSLERVRVGTPTARCLPLLAAIARATPAEVTLDYLSGLALQVTVSGSLRLDMANRGAAVPAAE